MRDLSAAQSTALEATLVRLTSAAKDTPSPSAPATAEEILQRIAARPWRRSAVDPATAADMAAKVQRAVAAGEPIGFSLPFGGYRGWQLPSAPDPDWSELFWIDYLRSFGQRITAVHPAGVRMSLPYVGGVMSWVNQLPEDAQNRYLHGLGQLLQSRSTPRLEFQLVDHAEAHGGRAAVLELLQAREACQPPPTDAELQRARRNLVWGDGFRDAEPPPETLIRQSARRCAVLMGLESRRAFNKDGPRLQLTHVRGAALSLHIGSCRSAVAQPWVALGFLQWCPEREEWIERLATGRAAWDARAIVEVDHRLAVVSPALRRLPLVP
ncbi:MAG: hypothetical protein ACK575_05665 [Cyanobacteriota bacterium]